MVEATRDASAGMSVERGDYGVVRILRGRRKGKLAYYDDDVGSESRPGKAVVYVGEPFESDYPARRPRKHRR